MKKRAPNYIPAIILIVAVVALTAVCGYFAFRPEKDVIQGQADVTEYRRIEQSACPCGTHSR